MQSVLSHSKIIESVRSLLPEIRCIYLFGSFASGKLRPDSDIDVAVFTGNKIDSIERWELQSKLAVIFNREVDLVDLLAASTVMQFQIIKNGICLYDKHRYSDKFEMQVMSMYQHLNLERADILNAVMEQQNG